MRVGILGGGQLGQMMTLAGYPLGIKASCFDASIDVPAALVGTVIPGEISDIQKLHRWASHVDVITYEWENYPAELVADLSEIKPVYPGPNALAITQDRWAEKRTFNQLDIPVGPFRTIQHETDLHRAIEELEGSIVLKTRTGGYDGKGQMIIKNDDDFVNARKMVQQSNCIAEQWIPFDSEISIIGVRGIDGETVIYPLAQNEHRNGILYTTVAPAPVANHVAEMAEQYMHSLLDSLQYVGVLALEMFEVGGRLFANEMAPRVHNSGHWTIEGAETSQFENHLRAITGMPLGSAEAKERTAMVNIIGTLPNRNAVLQISGAHLHLYNKDPRPGRKLGHVTVTAPNDEELRKRLVEVQNVVTGSYK